MNRFIKWPFAALVATALSAPLFADGLNVPWPPTGQTPGTTTNNSATAGNVGEYATANIGGGSATITVTIAAPGVVTWTAHPYSINSSGISACGAINFTTTGALPTGLAVATNYYASAVDANTLRLSTTVANCLAGTYITTTGSQSGTHTGQAWALLANITAADIGGMALTAGEWDIDIHGLFLPGSTTNITYLWVWLNTSSVTFNATPGQFALTQYGAGSVIYNASATETSLDVSRVRLLLSSTTNYFFGVRSGFTLSTLNGFGLLVARRVR